MVYYLEDDEDDTTNVLMDLLGVVKNKLPDFDESSNEHKLGLALCDILENYKLIFQTSDNNKLGQIRLVLKLQ